MSLRGHPLFMFARLLAEAVSRTEDASGAAGAVLRASEKASRTREGCFAHRMSLPYRRSLFFTPNASENASRTGGGLFEHGTHIRYRRGPSPVPSAVEGAGEGSAGDKFRVSGTKEMVEGAGANKVSEVLSEASCCRCGTSNFTIEAG